MSPFAWTSHRIAMLCALWPSESATTVAAALGTTRNAVISKANRLGLAKRPPARIAATHVPPVLAAGRVLDPFGGAGTVGLVADAMGLDATLIELNSEYAAIAERRIAGQLWALLHDAAEAYLTDVPRPLKPLLTGYREAEDLVMRALASRFGLPWPEPVVVKTLDGRILADEKAQIMASEPAPWTLYGDPLGVTIRCLSPAEAEAEFLLRFRTLSDAEAAFLRGNVAWNDGAADARRPE